METLRDFVERKPSLVKDWNQIVLKERLDKPYSYHRRDFPKWYLSTSECKALFGHYPQRVPDAFCYNPVGHALVMLFDCKAQLEALLKS